MDAVGKFRRIDPPPQLPPIGTSPALDQRLADDTADNEPLYLVMAGIISVIEGAPFAFSRGRDDLAEYIAEIEANRIKGVAANRHIDEEFACHLAACVTLEGGCDLDEARKIIKEERTFEYGGPASDGAILNMLPELLRLSRAQKTTDAPDLSGLDAIRPDLIGEAFLLKEIARPLRPMTDQLSIIQRAWRRSPNAVRRTLVNTNIDFWRGDPKSPMAIWRAHLETLSTEDFKARLDAGGLTPDGAVQQIWEIALTMSQQLALAEFVLPFIDRLSPQQIGAFAALRGVALVETGTYSDGLQFASTILGHVQFPAWWRPELLNVKGRCLFHLRRYGKAADGAVTRPLGPP
jgi:hypothetical protein